MLASVNLFDLSTAERGQSVHPLFPGEGPGL